MVTSLAVIPARYASTRFPGKPLAKDTGKYLIQHVYERVQQARRVDRVIVAHADLPLAQSFDEVVGTHGIVLVPDRHDDGTNVIVVPARAGFRFHYGPRSFVHHQIEARRLDLDPTIVRSDRLGWDIDTPADLAHPILRKVLPPWLPTIQANRYTQRDR